MDVKSRTKATIGATIIFAVVAALTMVSGASPASATPTHLDLGTIVIGSITVEYTGPSVLLSLVTHTLGWDITGGTEPVPAADVTFHLDLVTLGHMVLLLVDVLLYDTGDCRVNFHGPLLLASSDGDTYHGAFSKSALNGILYSEDCDPFLVGLILFTIASAGSAGVLVLFHTT